MTAAAIQRTLAMSLRLLLCFVAATFIGCSDAGTPPPKSLKSITEFFLNDVQTKAITDGSSFVYPNPTDANKITRVKFSRGYTLNSGPKGLGLGLNTKGVKTYEKIFVHKNDSGIPLSQFTVNTTLTNANGGFADEMAISDTDDLGSAFDIQITRIFYVKQGSIKLVLGGNFYQFKRDEGDAAAAVKTKSVCDPIYYPPNLDPPADRPAPIATKDSGG